jgi:hypothetical protein
MATKKQSKADKEFVAKIATIGINTGAPKKPKCKDCGKPIGPVGMLVGTIHGQHVAGEVYGHRPERRDSSDEQSFSM